LQKPTDSTSILLKFPIPIIQWTHLPRLQPPRDAVKVESVIADTPCDSAFFSGGGGLVSLAFDAQVHDVVTADGAVVNDDVPGPECDRVPLMYALVILSRMSFSSPPLEWG
jgi:hypothetical protein